MKTSKIALAAAAAGMVAVGACASGTGGATSGATPGTTAGASNTGGATGSMPGYAGGAATNAGAASGGMPAGGINVPPANGQPGTGTGQSTGTLTGGLNGQSSGASAIPGNTIYNLGSDARIISAVDVANTDEIAAATLARSRALSPRVRAFAEQMIREHGQMQAQDRNLASNPDFISSDSADVTLSMRQADNTALARLQNTPSGPAFDAMYMSQQVDAHKRTLALLKAAADQAKDTRVHALIVAAIPKVQQHLDEATAIQQQLGS